MTEQTEEKKTKAQTIYFPTKLIEQMGKVKSLNARVIDLIKKGLLFEENKVITSKSALEFLGQKWNDSHPKDKLNLN